MQFRVFDLETTTKERFGRKAEPFSGANFIQAYGWQDNAAEIHGLYYPEFTDVLGADFYIPDHIDLLVGHNIKFDITWIWKHPSFVQFIKRGGKIWCTQYAEYLLEGQQQHAQMCAMDDIAVAYGGHKKLDVVKAMWEMGYDTTDIPEDVLMEYLLEGDIPNTTAIFLGQLQRAQESGQLKMISTRMDGLLASTEMEYNGLYVDYQKGMQDAAELQAKLNELAAKLDDALPELPPELVFNWNSRFHKSALLFGGAVKYEKWVQHRDPSTGELLYCQKDTEEQVLDANGDPVRYKSGIRTGEIKTRKVKVPDLDRPKGAKQEFLYTFDRLAEPLPEWKGKGTLADDSPIYSTNADVISALGERPGLDGIAGLYAEFAGLDKDVGTYYINVDGTKGMLTLVDPDTGICHHSLNHTTTKTSRMSANNPNMQNLPRKDKSTVKTLFKSRRGASGSMLEIDYSQLEVVVQAWLTGDKQMITDVNNGVDFHCKRLSAKLGEAYEHVFHMAKVEEDPWYDLQRTYVKGFTFQRAYGAAAKSIAISLGIAEDEVVKLIEAEEKLYPGISQFDALLEKAIEKSAAKEGMRKREAHPFIPGKYRTYATGEWFSPTGTRFVWRQWEAMEFMKRRGIEMSFSPTERKNWPVQGTGGEVMQMALGMCFRYFVERGWWSGVPDAPALLVNTVHDCAWADAESAIMPEVAKCMHEILCAVPLFFEHRYGCKVPVRFRAEAEIGADMYDMHVLHLDDMTDVVNIQQLAERYL